MTAAQPSFKAEVTLGIGLPDDVRSTRPIHDAVLSGIRHPNWLIDGRLQDDRWVICTVDASKVRNAKEFINFRTCIAPDQFLNDVEFECDLLTAKLVVIYALHAEGKIAAASVAHTRFRNLVQFIRWRLSCGIPSNALLTSEWLQQLFERVKSNGVRGCISYDKRLLRLSDDIDKRIFEIPYRNESGIKTVLIKPLVRRLGVDEPTTLPDNIQDALTELIELSNLTRRKTQSYRGQDNRSDRLRAGKSIGRVRDFLLSIDYLYKFRHRLQHDPLSFEPFAGERTIGNVAKAISTRDKSNRTFTVPAKQACYLIDASLGLILNHSEIIFEFRELYTRFLQECSYVGVNRRVNWAFRKTSTHLRAIWSHEDDIKWLERILVGNYGGSKLRKTKDLMHVGRASIQTLLYDILPAAAIVVIAAFSARRREEITSLHHDCISFKDNEPLLETYIGKTIRDVDKIPVPMSVVRAAEVLSRLSQPRRERTGEPFITCFDHLNNISINGGVRPAGFNICRGLERLARFSDVPRLKDGVAWGPRPHEFRRFFAIVYFHHYRYANLTALSHHLRHFDPDMTRRYVTESYVGEMMERREQTGIEEAAARVRREKSAAVRVLDFEAASLDHRVERFKLALVGEERMSGHGGKRLLADLKSLVADVKPMMEITTLEDLNIPSINLVIHSFASGKRLDPNPLGHSYCKCTITPDDLATAACLEGVSVADPASFGAPNPANASDETCWSCVHNVQFPENQAYAERVVENEKARQGCSLAPILRAASERRLEMAERHLERCHE